MSKKESSPPDKNIKKVEYPASVLTINVCDMPQLYDYRQELQEFLFECDIKSAEDREKFGWSRYDILNKR